jgi:hypothetical protein
VTIVEAADRLCRAAEIPLAILQDMIPQFPSFTEGYWSALRALPA